MSVKRSHMLSRAYLKQWGDKGGNVEVIDILKRIGVTTDVVNATVVSYGYEPEVLKRDLEGEFSKIEALGIPALSKLRYGHKLSDQEKSDTVAFLDMHLHRGRYADQSEIDTPAVLLKTDGTTEEAKLKLADRLMLSQHMKDLLRLASLGIESWPWAVHNTKNLATGDGAVLLWGEAQDDAPSTVSFPLSPEHLLMIGRPLDARHFDSLNARLAQKSRRWIVGQVGTLNLDWARTVI
ncbi:DUF4238 domain-containing protein [Pseudoclavibacter sp. CFCC 11306]|uniref:DUF4238 domain-containing protein n=1 Tax=Pseudoclavibacter sp. CFCC 11306 TaxID=1564493 RepID=UPI0013015F89|nr:DUF4238 domain-containing protein [Pseudoclavibacter sp. CFCC 11306]KAB1658129.1 DUF4238 domain-containing protein [Pseudoclavibacter sp. CFCC 11306]